MALKRLDDVARFVDLSTNSILSDSHDEDDVLLQMQVHSAVKGSHYGASSTFIEMHLLDESGWLQVKTACVKSKAFTNES